MTSENPGTDRLFQVAPYLFLGAGILMLLIAFYAAGTENMTCSWKSEDLNCTIERFRLAGAYCSERKLATNVTDVLVRTSTTDNTYITPSQSKETTTSVNEMVILKTRSGDDVESLGGEKSGEYAERVEALLKDRTKGPLTLAESNWTFSYVLAGLGAVFVAFGAIAARFK